MCLLYCTVLGPDHTCGVGAGCHLSTLMIVMAALRLRRPSIGGGAGIGGSASTPPAEAPPQVKLGRVPKNARLNERTSTDAN
jgi:hypothetical protein